MPNEKDVIAQKIEENKNTDTDLKQKSQDLTDKETSLQQRELDISAKELELETEKNKNQEWSIRLENAEKGLRGRIAEFVALKGKERDTLRIDVENLMKLLCTPLVWVEGGYGYTSDSVENVIEKSIKIVSRLLENKCGVKPLFNDSGEYLDSVKRKQLGYKLDGSKYSEWEERKEI